MSMFGKARPQLPQEVKVSEPPMELVPRKYQQPVDPSMEAVTKGVEAFAGLRSAYAALEDHHQDTVVALRAKENECTFLQLELAKAQNERDSQIAIANEALRDRDRAIDIIQTLSSVLGRYDLNPPPTPRKKPRNGKTEEVQTRPEDQVPVPPSGEAEVRELHDVPPAG